MLDANILILLLNLDPSVTELAGDCFEGDLCASVIAYAEVVRGSVVGKGPALEVIQQAMEAIPIMPFDAAAAQAYARLPFARHRFDRLIAAQALSLDLTLVTANVRDFADVPNLRVEDWTV